MQGDFELGVSMQRSKTYTHSVAINLKKATREKYLFIRVVVGLVMARFFPQRFSRCGVAFVLVFLSGHIMYYMCCRCEIVRTARRR